MTIIQWFSAVLANIWGTWATTYHRNSGLWRPQNAQALLYVEVKDMGDKSYHSFSNRTRILISSFLQGLKAPRATKRYFHDPMNGRGHLSEHECTQRRSRGNQKQPTSSNCSSLIYHATIEQMTMNDCSFNIRGTFVGACRGSHRFWPTNKGRTLVHNLGLFSLFKWHLNNLCIDRREFTLG